MAGDPGFLHGCKLYPCGRLKDIIKLRWRNLYPQDGVFDLSFHVEDEAAAISRLMDRFDDVPMSLADACLVRLSELHPKLPLVTLDSDFKVYRRHGRQMLPVISPDSQP